jgi:hypothetical protein
MKNCRPLLGSKQVSSWTVGSTYFWENLKGTHFLHKCHEYESHINQIEDHGFIFNQWIDTSCQFSINVAHSKDGTGV